MRQAAEDRRRLLADRRSAGDTALVSPAGSLGAKLRTKVGG